MKTFIVLLSIVLLAACGNGSNENKGTGTETPSVTPSSTVAADSAHADTMMQPNGVTNGTVAVDSTNNK